ncbi:MAG: S8 family peptidase [Rhodospirillales bacterium]|nr:S8 family peptidase [Rhodospirillales bacterium]
MAQPPRNRPHLWIEGGGDTERYTRPPQKIETQGPPARNRRGHADALTAAIGEAIIAGHDQIAAREDNIAEGIPGFYLEMQISPNQWEALKSLGNRKQHIEVVTVKPMPEGAGEQVIEATVFIPETAEAYFRDKVTAYRNEDTRNGNPKNQTLVASLDTVRIASVQSLFTDPPELYPANRQVVWWEVWLRKGTWDRFVRVVGRLNVQRKDHTISFREREVTLVLANEETMSRIVRNCDAVAELRIAKDTPALFMQLGPAEAVNWTDDILHRIAAPGGDSPSVCLLDSGVTQAHPLIQPALDLLDMHTYDPAWGTGDTVPQWMGHGTAMSGLALYGDLQPHIVGTALVALSHKLESVKILPPAGQNDPDLYGDITRQAVASAEIQAPDRQRVVCMAVTSAPVPSGHPSSWSAAVDELCFDEDNRRLVILAAGNIRDGIDPAVYPNRNDVMPVEDPAQSWNALTVGAFTEKVNVIDPAYAGWEPVAPSGEISPASRTSNGWQRQWPVKPDVVFEGGNYATDAGAPAEPIDDLQLLTTHSRPNIRMFDVMGDTSAATALAANLAGRIMAARPELRPETVRGLIVHSAEWTPAMFAQIEGQSKTQMEAMLRRYGYGVPDFGRALMSAMNDLTLMVEDELTPFEKSGSNAKTRDMKVHRLPWPTDALTELGEMEVQFRLTLSYFIEPNPGERGWSRRHRYASHNLRFAVKHATESLAEFRRRINKVAREEEEGLPVGPVAADKWLLGPKIQTRGSIHSDWWSGSAADLAERDAIGIFPVGGWWKEKPYLGRADTATRYSLIVSIKAPGAVTDIYTPVANQIAVPVVVG